VLALPARLFLIKLDKENCYGPLPLIHKAWVSGCQAKGGYVLLVVLMSSAQQTMLTS